MAIVRQPGDEGATVTRNTDGESTDVADGGFPAIKGYDVRIYIKASTNSGSCTADNPGTVSVVMALQWSDDGGGSWNLFGSDVVETVNAINGGSDSSTGWPNPTAAVAVVGNVADLSQIQVRARVTNSFTGAGTGTGTATMTDWEISYRSLGAIIEA